MPEQKTALNRFGREDSDTAEPLASILPRLLSQRGVASLTCGAGRTLVTAGEIECPENSGGTAVEGAANRERGAEVFIAAIVG